MAFWFFLSLVPLAAVAGLLTAKVASGRSSTMAPLLESLPAATRGLVSTELAKVAAWNGGQVGVVGGLMFLWLASSGVHSVINGIELELDATPRAWWQNRLLALGTCVGLSIGVALLALLAAGVGSAWSLVSGSTMLGAVDLESTLVGRAARLSVGAGVWVALVSGLYLVALPASSRKRMPIVPGAVLATVLQFALGFAYRFYLSKAGDGGAYQAGLASIGVTLTALYLACLVLLVGIEFNRSRMADEPVHRPE
ncbi:MAG: YihY/virulence factor BrkB family protein [Deltaproteobacteria bacterium]|nr:YihY/virulence factor BrkB family protein [Deltaproteobacteria bacterium]